MIAEFKRRSPSAGALRERPELGEIVSAYSGAGPSPCRFSPRDPTSRARSRTSARRVRACDLPLLRKDFIVDPYQLHEAGPPAQMRCC